MKGFKINISTARQRRKRLLRNSFIKEMLRDAYNEGKLSGIYPKMNTNEFEEWYKAYE